MHSKSGVSRLIWDGRSTSASIVIIRACLEWSIFKGISKDSLSYVFVTSQAFGTKERPFPFRRKGLISFAKRRKKRIHREPKFPLIAEKSAHEEGQRGSSARKQRLEENRNWGAGVGAAVLLPPMAPSEKQGRRSLPAACGTFWSSESPWLLASCSRTLGREER